MMALARFDMRAAVALLVLLPVVFAALFFLADTDGGDSDEA